MEEVQEEPSSETGPVTMPQADNGQPDLASQMPDGVGKSELGSETSGSLGSVEGAANHAADPAQDWPNQEGGGAAGAASAPKSPEFRAVISELRDVSLAKDSEVDGLDGKPVDESIRKLILEGLAR